MFRFIGESKVETAAGDGVWRKRGAQPEDKNRGTVMCVMTWVRSYLIHLDHTETRALLFALVSS